MMKKLVAWLLLSMLSVLFHFDCVTSKEKNLVEVSLTLKSSPVPGEKSLTPLSESLKLEPATADFNFRHARHRRYLIFDSYHRILLHTTDMPVEQTEVVMTINFTVVGRTVKIKIGPIQHNFTYRVCLSKVSKEYECYKDLITRQGQDVVAFTDVEPDTYKIYVQKQPNPDNPMFVTKQFNVTEIPSSEKPTIAASNVAIITLACLLFVAGVTTLCFCLMKKHCGCFPMCLKTCYCPCHKTEHSPPNNMFGDQGNDSILEILPVYYEESESFTFAIRQLCLYLSKWANCHINYDWANQIINNPEMSFKDSHPNCLLLIFLSSKMWTLLNGYQHLDDPKSKILNKILIESDGKAFKRMIVSFHPLSGFGDYFHHCKIYKIRKTTVSSMGNKVEMNTEVLYQMLKEINEDEIKLGWSGYEEMNSLSNAIKYIPEKDLDCWPHSLSNFVCNVKQKNRQKQLETYKWAESQQNKYCSPCSQNGYIPATVDDDRVHDKYSYEVDTDIDSASVCQDGCYPMIRQNLDQVIDWSPPEEDSESVTQSVIGQKQIEIYQNYKANMSDTRL